MDLNDLLKEASSLIREFAEQKSQEKTASSTEYHIDLDELEKIAYGD